MQMQPTSPMPPHPLMQPQHLDFMNPQPYSAMSTPQSSRTPMTLTPTCSDTSPHGSESSSLTPSLNSLALGRGCGHPHKEILPPPLMMTTPMELVKLKYRSILNVKELKCGDFKS